MSCSVILAELKAIFFGLKFAIDCGLRAVIVEGDSLSAIQMICSLHGSLSLEGSLVEDIKIFAAFFDKISFIFAPRKCNRVAHELAKWACSVCNDVFILEEVPSVILPFVLDDFCSS